MNIFVQSSIVFLYIRTFQAVRRKSNELKTQLTRRARERGSEGEENQNSARLRKPLRSRTLKSPMKLTQLSASSNLATKAKPKIDPFEFSRNLEEGMRAVAVCAVISGQSPVDVR